MSEITLFDPKVGMPAHVAGFFDEMGSNVPEKQGVPSLSPQGKVWTVSVDGQKTPLQKRNDDGDMEPLSTMKVVVLDFNKRRGRSYYEGGYDPDKESAPICWSDDGITPHKSVPDDQKKCGKCEDCPMSVKGSKVTDQGKAVVACSQFRMLAVVPANKLDFTPLRLKIAITSDWDKQSPDLEAQGWYAFSNYLDFLKSRGVNHTAALVTKMKFDAGVAYPKIIFSPDRWLEADEVAQIAPVVKSEAVQSLLGGSWTPAGPDGKRTDEPTKVEDKSEAEATPAPKEEPKPEPKAEVAEKPAVEPIDEPKAKKAEDAPAASTTVPDDVAALLADWGG